MAINKPCEPELEIKGASWIGLRQCFPLWTLVALLIASTLYSVYRDPLGIAVTAAVSIFALTKGLVDAVKFVGAFFRRKWRQAATRLIAALLTVVAIPASLWAGDYLHLAVFYAFYARSIGDGAQVRKFAWGDAALSAIDGTNLRILVFDPKGTFIDKSDEPALTFSKTHLVGPWYVEEVSSK